MKPDKHELIEQPQGELMPRGTTDIDVPALLKLAVDKDLDVDKLRALVELANSQRKELAAREFVTALARFKAECPPLEMNRTAKIASNKGAAFSYEYASLGQIRRTVDPLLATHGFVLTCDGEQTPTHYTAIAILSHVNGHEKLARFTVPTQTNAGMSDQQKVGAAATYADRQAAKRVLGIVEDDDNDGADDPAEPITADQSLSLEARVDDVGGDKAAFLRFAGVSRFADIPASRLVALEQALAAKEQQASSKK